MDREIKSLADYESVTGKWKYKLIENVFHTNPELPNKINDDGSYKPFFGSTVVFIADEPCVHVAREMQTALHASVGDMLAAPLPVSSFHMTLHDLISPEKCASDPSDAESYRREVEDSFAKAKRIVSDIQKEYAGKTIIMDADRVVNMVSKSLVLMLIPHSEEDFQRLMSLYRRFDTVVNLGRGLTPHVTLAYYRPGPLDPNRLNEAIAPIQVQKDTAPSFTFRMEALTAQLFNDMQTYS